MSIPELRKVPPLPIPEFRNVGEFEQFEIPEVSENRRCTDIIFLIFFILSVLTMIILVIISAIGTDYSRFLHGYDQCGNTCGSKNKPIPEVECSGKDMKDKPFMFVQFTELPKGYAEDDGLKILPDECVSTCDPPNRLQFHRCFPPRNVSLGRSGKRVLTFAEFIEDLKKSVMLIIVPMAAVGLMLSVGLLFCFHFFPNKTVFSLIILQLVGLFAFTSYVWYLFLEDTSKSEHLYIGIGCTIIIFFICIFICYFYDRYALVIQMFKEATEAIFKMPLLILQPLMAILVLSVMVTSMVFLAALLSTHQTLEKVTHLNNTYEYVNTTLSEAAITYMVLIAIWIIALANGCQCMVVGGSVAAYYFARDKSTLKYPVLHSIFMLMRYHLGTVAFGSLFITIVTVARVSVDFLDEHDKCKQVVRVLQCCTTCLEGFVDYIAKRAYIQTAIHGKPLFKSGKRAARLLWANLMDTISLDVVGEFIMICALILLTVVTAGIGITVHIVTDLNLTYFWSVLTIGAAVAGTLGYFFSQIISVAVETIFLCFCEDKLLNDGKLRPYFMSEELKNLIDKAKKTAKGREQ
jgi:solute carrier family 44 protein 1 (choline transporter-like protein)